MRSFPSTAFSRRYPLERNRAILAAVSIRAVAICVVRHDDRLLGFEVPDSSKGVVGFRPLGGGIRAGERAIDAVARELREELGAELDGPRLLGVLENIFTYEDRPGHEVVFVYEADLLDETLYAAAELEIREETETLVGLWKPIDEFRSGRMPLYPNGLLELLEASSGPRLDKVVAYIVHEGEFLVFLHEADASVLESGIQVPAGTVRAGESPADAVVREAHEETGLDGLEIVRFLGTAELDAAPYRDEIWVRHFFQLRLTRPAPRTWTWHERGDPPDYAGEPIPFRFSWVPLSQGAVVSACQGLMLSRVVAPAPH